MKTPEKLNQTVLPSYTIRPLRIKSVHQNEDHTCGLCAMRAFLNYMGVTYDRDELRFLLGVDHTLPNGTPWRAEAEMLIGNRGAGVFPHDMCFVLAQYGFDFECIGRFERPLQKAFHTSLAEGFPIVAWLDIDELGGDHWLLVVGMNRKGVWLCDSTEKDLYLMEWLKFEKYLWMALCPIALYWDFESDLPVQVVSNAKASLRASKALVKKGAGMRWISKKFADRFSACRSRMDDVRAMPDTY